LEDIHPSGKIEKIDSLEAANIEIRDLKKKNERLEQDVASFKEAIYKSEQKNLELENKNKKLATLLSAILGGTAAFLFIYFGHIIVTAMEEQDKKQDSVAITEVSEPAPTVVAVAPEQVPDPNFIGVGTIIQKSQRDGLIVQFDDGRRCKIVNDRLYRENNFGWRIPIYLSDNPSWLERVEY
jgi:FtsZ-binding cell division protein ZapB